MKIKFIYKRLICLLFGHNEVYYDEGYFWEYYCNFCGAEWTEDKEPEEI